jgi:hypothetical protein
MRFFANNAAISAETSIISAEIAPACPTCTGGYETYSVFSAAPSDGFSGVILISSGSCPF